MYHCLLISNSIGIKCFRNIDLLRTAMGASVRELIFILQLFFPPELAVQHALYVLGVLISLYPVFRLHTNQLREARRQSPLTGWKRTIRTLLSRAFLAEMDDPEAWSTGINVAPGINLAAEYTDYICGDIDKLYTLLGLNDASPLDPTSSLFQRPRPILATTRMNCRFCLPGHRNLVPSLRRRKKGGNQAVWLLDDNFHWVSADLLVAQCGTCKADYYPDRITRPGQGRHRAELLEYDAVFLRVSKSGEQ